MEKKEGKVSLFNIFPFKPFLGFFSFDQNVLIEGFVLPSNVFPPVSSGICIANNFFLRPSIFLEFLVFLSKWKEPGRGQGSIVFHVGGVADCLAAPNVVSYLLGSSFSSNTHSWYTCFYYDHVDTDTVHTQRTSPSVHKPYSFSKVCIFFSLWDR